VTLLLDLAWGIAGAAALVLILLALGRAGYWR
jgi:hypothetical protein